MTIIFEPKYKIGDMVSLRLSVEKKFVISGYSIRQITSSGEVSFWRYLMYDEDGTEFLYNNEDIILVDSLESAG